MVFTAKKELDVFQKSFCPFFKKLLSLFFSQ